MKKSIILAGLLFSIPSFAIISKDSNGVCWEYLGSNTGTCAYNSNYSLYDINLNAYCGGYVIGMVMSVNGTTSITYGRVNDVSCVPTNCSNGLIWSNTSQSCITPPVNLSAYNNDVDGCHAHDGLLKANGDCVSYVDFGSYLLTEPTAFLGGGLFINGYLFTAAGLAGATLLGPATMAGAAFATIGGVAMVSGVGMALYGASDDIAANFVTNPSNDITIPAKPATATTPATPETRVKINLDQYDASTVASSDLSSGKVQEISYIPPEVKQRILEGVVNPTTGLPDITPSDLAGTTTTKYNYTSNTATTETMKSDGTTVTSTTPFTPITNPDGTVTAQSHNESIAPTVTGTKSSTIEVPAWNQYQTIAQWTETIKTNSGTGSTSGGGTTGTTPAATGDATADALLNAEMPSYDTSGTGEFDTLDKSIVDDMSNTTTGFIDNIQSQIDAAQTVYDQTSALISGGWESPQIPAGECGTAMSMDFNGKHIDVCPHLANFLSPISPLISFLVTIAGTAFAIAIFIGGF